MTWSGRPHIDATASGAILLSTVPTSPERGFLAADGCGPWYMLPSFTVVCLEVLGQAPQRQRLFLESWGYGVDVGGCLLLYFLLQMMSAALRLFSQASDDLSNTVSAPQFLHLSSRHNNVWL